MDSAEHKILNNYFELIQGLTSSMKLRLIERLKDSMKPTRQKMSQIEESFGSWHSSESSDELIETI